MKNLLKWLNQNAIAAGMAVIVGALFALYVGDTWTGVLSGSLTMFVTAWIIKSGWAQSILVTRTDMKKYLTDWEARKERRKLLAERKRSEKDMIARSIASARKQSEQAEKAWQILTYLNGGISDKYRDKVINLLRFAAVLGILCFLIFVLSTNPISETIFMSAAASAVLLLFFWLFFEINFLFRYYIFDFKQKYYGSLERDKSAYHNFRSDVGYISSQTGLQKVLNDRYNKLIRNKADVEEIEKALLAQAIFSLELISRPEHLHPCLWKYVQNEVTLGSISRRAVLCSLVNLFWWPIFATLFFLRAAFVFANHETRGVAFVATMTGSIYLTLTHLYFGGIDVNNLNYWLLLFVSAVTAGYGAQRFISFKEKFFDFNFSKPERRLLKVENLKF